MNDDLLAYLDYTKKPWGELFYKMVWAQLPPWNNLKILDFGSGFGITANHLAKDNEVVAIEPNAEIVEMRSRENNYQQLIGDVDQLKQLKDNSFDAVVCHNVLEYVTERENILKEFCRVLKPNGRISIIKHNHAGRIMQKVVFENNIDEALSLLDGGVIKAMNFGQVNYYNINDIINGMDNNKLNVEKVLGIRVFWGLQQNNEMKFDPSWQEKMFEIEMKVSELEEYKTISFFHHILLQKVD